MPAHAEHDARSVLDFIAIGLGPFNLGLACLMVPLREHSGLFLERNAGFAWHPGMLVDGCTMQNPFLADLVSLADPTSPYSYLNYCKLQGRLQSCYIRENFYLTRRDYNRYCQWAASRLSSVRFQHEVLAVAHEAGEGLYLVSGRDRHSGRAFEYRCRRLVLGTGSAPRWPACCEALGDACLHSADYLGHKSALQSRRSITIVGSGQSAAEIFCDLLKDMDRHAYRLNWVTRSSRFFQMENARLALELISPDYAGHFHGLSAARKQEVLRGQQSVYNGINAQLINEIYERLDDDRETLAGRTCLLPNMELRGARHDKASGRHVLDFFHTERERHYRHQTEGLVLATGYAPRVPPFVDGIRHRIAWNEDGGYRQARNYAVDLEAREIFAQNAGLASHGVTNPDLGLACHRNACIIQGLTGVAYYPIESGTTLQDFAPRADSPFIEVA
jgi:lysine N6-hydroxylase